MYICQECGEEIHELELHVSGVCPFCTSHLQLVEDDYEDHYEVLREEYPESQAMFTMD